eukprot:gene43416-19392_t
MPFPPPLPAAALPAAHRRNFGPLCDRDGVLFLSPCTVHGEEGGPSADGGRRRVCVVTPEGLFVCARSTRVLRSVPFAQMRAVASSGADVCVHHSAHGGSLALAVDGAVQAGALAATLSTARAAAL